MLVSPLVGSMAYQHYHFTMTHALADSESILTQLVFDYSLKVRVKAETPGQQRGGKGKGSSFIGKLNNLVTIDLRNIGGARDLVLLCKSLRLTINLYANNFQFGLRLYR